MIIMSVKLVFKKIIILINISENVIIFSFNTPFSQTIKMHMI